jgi:hypothetical protein
VNTSWAIRPVLCTAWAGRPAGSLIADAAVLAGADLDAALGGVADLGEELGPHLRRQRR